MRTFRRPALLVVLASVAAALTSCGRQHRPERWQFVPVAEVERTYGSLVGAGNLPTANQHGNGERIGFFQDASGTVWGLPLSVTNDADILACAPPEVRDAKVTDSFASGARIIGSTNMPTGWRGGTGDLELLLRDQSGAIHGQEVRGADMPAGPVCGAPRVAGTPGRLHYYRVAPGMADKQ